MGKSKPAAGSRRGRGGGRAVSDESAAAIRLRAYELHEARVREGRVGDALGDWLQAEHELHASSAGAADDGGAASIEITSRAGAKAKARPTPAKTQPKGPRKAATGARS